MSAATGAPWQPGVARWWSTSAALDGAGFTHAYCHLGRPDDRSACDAVATGCMLQQARQVHGRAVTRANGWSPDSAPEADAVISRDASVACAVRTADCAPVLVGCRATGAVAAIHAGWRGIALGVIGTAIEAMVRDLGATPSAMVAAVGPCARACHYEVGEEVAAAMAGTGCADAVVRRPDAPRPFLDVARAAALQLAAAGVSPDCIDADPPCSIESLWCPSHRRDPSSGARMLSLIVARDHPHHG